MTNYSWFLESDLTGFEGKWIAIKEEKVVASSETLKHLFKEVKNRFSTDDVSFVKVPSSKEAIVYLIG